MKKKKPTKEDYTNLYKLMFWLILVFIFMAEIVPRIYVWLRSVT